MVDSQSPSASSAVVEGGMEGQTGIDYSQWP